MATLRSLTCVWIVGGLALPLPTAARDVDRPSCREVDEAIAETEGRIDRLRDEISRLRDDLARLRDERTQCSEKGSGRPPADEPGGEHARAFWTLREVRAFDSLEDGKVLSASHDASGGVVELQLSGNALSLCPGGSDRIRVRWDFEGTAYALNPKGKVSARLTPELLTRKPPCSGGLAARTTFSIGGSNGQVSPTFPAEEAKRIDGNAFWPATAARVFVDPEKLQPNNTGVLNVEASENPSETLAWFSVDIDTPGGSLKYVYLYGSGADHAPPRAGGDRDDEPLSRREHPVKTFTGKWYSSAWGEISLIQRGDEVTGRYTRQEGTLTCAIDRELLLCAWTGDDGDKGNADFFRLPDGSFEGRWCTGANCRPRDGRFFTAVKH